MATSLPPCCEYLPELTKTQHDKLASIFHLLGDDGRLHLVMACIETPRTVTELSAIATMSQPLTSHHLRQLREARILKSTRHGKQMLYELDDHHIRHVLLDMATHILEPEETDRKGEGDGE
ncbi:MAG: metalloregulator ArsR/SmtB family transcription factor [Candidatus Endonucleobacter bathymodioli]|uniref:Metalloregulator ArsR/SmtB family transcription factor n=1 Tax=Candidatus Endonucleibacter bathymodioli TaxID=539814 RepID=A0AA90P081_9GAMM|nr:metalloregulator ArsR/SmtB family transcription factor [Candidatus Endonucleobacter bathymodioli]